jgi:hypothetical protein
MSSSTYNIGIKVQNNTTAEQTINLLSNPFDLQNNLNAKTQYRWNITSFSFASETEITLEYKPVGASIYSIYSSSIQPNINSLLAALNNLGIGYFYTYSELGQTYVTTYNDQYVFNDLNIYNPSAFYSLGINVLAQAPSATVVDLFYQINLSGTWVLAASTAMGFPNYNSTGVGFILQIGDIVWAALRVGGLGGLNIIYGDGQNSGIYTGFCGTSTYASTVVTGNTEFYLNASIVAGTTVSC